MVAEFNQCIHAQLAKKLELFKELHHLLFMSLLSLSQQSGKVLFLNRQKVGVLSRNNSGCPRLIFYQGKFSELAAIAQSNHFVVTFCLF